MKKGYTLVELIVVITIIAILLSAGFAACQDNVGSIERTIEKQEECDKLGKIYRYGSCMTRFEYCVTRSEDVKVIELCLQETKK